MTAPELGAIALLAVAAELARRLASPRRFPHHRPVAIAVAALLALDIALELLQALVLQPARASLGTAPYSGGARVAFHLEQAIRFSFPAVSLVLGCHVLAPRVLRRPLIGAVAVAVAVLTVNTAARYPELRGAALLTLYARVHLASAVAGAGLAGGYLARVATGRAWPSPPQRCALVLLAGDIAALLGPFLIPARAAGDWYLAHAINLVCYGLLAVEQGRILWRSTPVLISGACSSSSASSRRSSGS